jgi:hypothetical protein
MQVLDTPAKMRPVPTNAAPVRNFGEITKPSTLKVKTRVPGCDSNLPFEGPWAVRGGLKSKSLFPPCIDAAVKHRDVGESHAVELFGGKGCATAALADHDQGSILWPRASATGHLGQWHKLRAADKTCCELRILTDID